jgi:hypothetical protein
MLRGLRARALVIAGTIGQALALRGDDTDGETLYARRQRPGLARTGRAIADFSRA